MNTQERKAVIKNLYADFERSSTILVGAYLVTYLAIEVVSFVVDRKKK
jgi:hypothetical protein